MRRLLYKIVLRFIRYPIWVVSPSLCTRITAHALRALGTKLEGNPNYLSALIWFDGGDYSLIELGHGVTVSSNVRLLTHDWSPYTAARSILGDSIEPKGPTGKIVLMDYAFVGTGAILLPGTAIGRGAVVGAGAVVKGEVPEGAIVAGNPAKVVGATKDLVRRYYGAG